jgi:hypothetical protein
VAYQLPIQLPPRPARLPCRDADDRKERFLRLKAEFAEWPDLLGMERLLEAFVAWRRSGQDRRCLSIEPELKQMERDARERIRLREAGEAESVSRWA